MELLSLWTKADGTPLLIHISRVNGGLILTMSFRYYKPLIVRCERVNSVYTVNILFRKAGCRESIPYGSFAYITHTLLSPVHPDCHLLLQRFKNKRLIAGSEKVRDVFNRNPHLVNLIEEVIGLRIKCTSPVSLCLMKDLR